MVFASCNKFNRAVFAGLPGGLYPALDLPIRHGNRRLLQTGKQFL